MNRAEKKLQERCDEACKQSRITHIMNIIGDIE